MTRKTQVITLNKNWWQQERAENQSENLIIAKKQKLPKEPFMTVKEVAKKLNVGIWSIYDYIASGDLECQIVGRRKRISVEALEEFLMRQNKKRGA